MLSLEGKAMPVIDWVEFTTLCSLLHFCVLELPYQALMQPGGILVMVYQERFVGVFRDVSNLFTFLSLIGTLARLKCGICFNEILKTPRPCCNGEITHI